MILFLFMIILSCDNENIIINNNDELIPLPIPLPQTLYHYLPDQYTQLGILVKNHNDKYPVILPLIGRRLNKYKMQYYTNSHNGNLNIRKKKNSKIYNDEYGIDELYSNDIVYVDGYQQEFQVTI